MPKKSVNGDTCVLIGNGTTSATNFIFMQENKHNSYSTLSTCGCQYSSCTVCARDEFMREKNVGWVKYKFFSIIPKFLATAVLILFLIRL